MVEIPEHLLLRSAEARAKALGISVEQALAEMKGDAEPTVVEKIIEPTVIEKTSEVETELKEEASTASAEQTPPDSSKDEY